MRSIIATDQSRRTAIESAGVSKLAGNDSQKPQRALRSLDNYFWYISSDEIHRLATSSGILNEIPQQINNYVFDPSIFKYDEYPSTFPEDRAWPPKELQELLFARGPEGGDCVGAQCYTSVICNDPRCRHRFEN